ncbi:site-specific DNA-methyltransferase [Siminovitchia fortis]|uniref:Site-specific DNA-methyltransferase n=1 Tax=Siminovitchia fortis TaxID=254758 RepID=A0A443IUV2_9BACI|nr:site-specific DNA-methyltransferase [Siminovitchia fortis]RWR11897.1 site-specific DNA-methyltransferase [Siminovitchia fortis]WHY81819.1 site-specific DNA-methyltransferase [Siminovitchia fortis]
MATTQQQKFVELLKEMFQFDQADLDFGIYRIMNQKRDEINKFLHEDLVPQVKQAFEKYKNTDVEKIKHQIEELETKLSEMGVAKESSEKYLILKEKLNQGVDLAALENEVFSHLTTFFRRYYDKGDFISLRRYKKDVYAIPYEGEEVKLHWANADQYYVKTSEYFRDYTFKLPSGKTVHFKLVEASAEQNNNKAQEERFFILNEDEPIKEQDGELFIYFEYRPTEAKLKQNQLNEKAKEHIFSLSGYNDWLKELQSLAPTEKNKKRTLFEKHLTDYTARNTFDYFIHKDLGGFLRRELDFYIKNEVMHLDDLDTENEKHFEQYLSKIKVIKNIGHKIIAFLEQIENFQKKLWLKKKFIIESNYCITLDKISEEFYPEIINNRAQINEWKKLFSIDEITSDLTSLSEEFLRSNPYLVVDTKYFDETFKDNILKRIENLDQAINGVLIHSDNFHALNLLQKKHEEQIKCCYIDPPYNTNASKIIYKNGYEHSSWLSLMHDRVRLVKNLLNKSGIIQVAIDDYEFRRLNMLMDYIFGQNNFISNIAILTNPKGRDQEYIAQAHDYTIIYSKDKKFAETNHFVLSDEEMSKKYSIGEGEESYRELPLKRTGSGKWREDRPYMFFPFIYNLTNEELKVIPKNEYEKLYNKEQNAFDDKFLKLLKEKYENTNHIFILPKDENGNYLRWRWGYDSCVEGVKNGSLYVKRTRKGTYNIYEKNAGKKFVTPKSLWFGEKYDASSKGTNLLGDILPNNHFDYPKSIYTVMDSINMGANKDSLIIDFFAGSGTAGHAVINLNREDGGSRKYILVEMGEYFNTVTKPRIQKVIYSKDWKDGKPLSREGSSHMFKYIKLESYEDTLNNIKLKRTGEQQAVLDELSDEVKEEYLLNYMLDNEAEGSASLLNIDAFRDPFNYQMMITNGTESKLTKVDLIETFNYLIGLHVKTVDMIKGIKVINGTLRTGEKVLVLWRNLDEVSNEQLENFFNKQGYNSRDTEYDRIYINGDNHIENLKLDEDKWKVILIEEEFKRLMFDISDI